MSIYDVVHIGKFTIGGQVLSDVTRRRLIALGIDPSGVTSEAEAKLLIENKMQKLQAIEKTQTESNSKNTCSSEAEVLSRAKFIAQKLGIVIPQNAKGEDILRTLSEKITQMLAQDSKNTDLKSYKTEVESMKNEYQTIAQTQNSIYSMLNQSANLNKYILGL